MEINKLSLDSHYEPKSIYNLQPILYVGVQFQSYSWMCVGGNFIVLVFEGLLERVAVEKSGSKGESEKENRRKVSVFLTPKWYLLWGKGQYILQEIS